MILVQLARIAKPSDPQGASFLSKSSFGQSKRIRFRHGGDSNAWCVYAIYPIRHEHEVTVTINVWSANDRNRGTYRTNATSTWGWKADLPGAVVKATDEP